MNPNKINILALGLLLQAMFCATAHSQLLSRASSAKILFESSVKLAHKGTDDHSYSTFYALRLLQIARAQPAVDQEASLKNLNAFSDEVHALQNNEDPSEQRGKQIFNIARILSKNELVKNGLEIASEFLPDAMKDARADKRIDAQNKLYSMSGLPAGSERQIWGELWTRSQKDPNLMEVFKVFFRDKLSTDPSMSAQEILEACPALKEKLQIDNLVDSNGQIHVQMDALENSQKANFGILIDEANRQAAQRDKDFKQRVSDLNAEAVVSAGTLAGRLISFKNAEFGRDVGALFEAGQKIYEAKERFLKPESALSLMGGKLRLSTDIVSVTLNLLSAFGVFGGGPSEYELLREEIHKLRQDIQTLNDNMIEGFDEVDTHIRELHKDVMTALDRLESRSIKIHESVKALETGLADLQDEMRLYHNEVVELFKSKELSDLRTKLRACAISNPNESEFSSCLATAFVWGSEECLDPGFKRETTPEHLKDPQFVMSRLETGLSSRINLLLNVYAGENTSELPALEYWNEAASAYVDLYSMKWEGWSRAFDSDRTWKIYKAGEDLAQTLDALFDASEGIQPGEEAKQKEAMNQGDLGAILKSKSNDVLLQPLSDYLAYSNTVIQNLQNQKTNFETEEVGHVDLLQDIDGIIEGQRQEAFKVEGPMISGRKLYDPALRAIVEVGGAKMDPLSPSDPMARELPIPEGLESFIPPELKLAQKLKLGTIDVVHQMLGFFAEGSFTGWAPSYQIQIRFNKKRVLDLSVTNDCVGYQDHSGDYASIWLKASAPAFKKCARRTKLSMAKYREGEQGVLGSTFRNNEALVARWADCYNNSDLSKNPSLKTSCQSVREELKKKNLGFFLQSTNPNYEGFTFYALSSDLSDLIDELKPKIQEKLDQEKALLMQRLVSGLKSGSDNRVWSVEMDKHRMLFESLIDVGFSDSLANNDFLHATLYGKRAIFSSASLAEYLSAESLSSEDLQKRFNELMPENKLRIRNAMMQVLALRHRSPSREPLQSLDVTLERLKLLHEMQLDRENAEEYP